MAFESKSKIVLCCAGIQGGKSTVGAAKGLFNSFPLGKRDHFIIGAPSYKILNQSTLPTWLKYAGQFGEYRKGDQEFHFYHGPVGFIRTSTDPDSIEGIPRVRWGWMDEAGKCKYQFYVNMEGRCAAGGGQMTLTTTPYALNWPHQSLIKPFKAGLRKDVDYFEWISIENPAFPKDEYERQRQILDPRTFRRKYMGIHERMEGLVYELGDQNKCISFALPHGTRYFAAVDWGFSEGHEFAISVRAITLDGFRYMVDEFKSSGLDPNQQIDICRAKKSLWGIELFGCDPSRPDMISLLNKSGCAGIGFHEGRESYKGLIAGITLHTALIRSGKYKIFEDKCAHAVDEYETYHWHEFEEGMHQRDEPVKVNDHIMDCERMLTVLTNDVFVKEAPKPFLTRPSIQIDRFDPKKPSRRTKNWDTY